MYEFIQPRGILAHSQINKCMKFKDSNEIKVILNVCHGPRIILGAFIQLSDSINES